jgi:hypothetical protein
MITPYPLTPELLHEGIGHTCYEYANLMSAASWSLRGDAPWRTNADDAFLLGYRKLGDFLLNKRRSRKGFQGEENPDILALDYLPPGYKPMWTLATWKTEWRAQMNKQLAHLSFIRDKEWVHYKWVPILEDEFRTTWSQFIAAVDYPFKAEFAAQIAHCQAKQGFERIRLVAEE